MRSSRIKDRGECWYHLVSRTAFQEFKFEEEQKTEFVSMLRRVAIFSGIDVLNYCVMTNHFHILVHVPKPVEITDEILLRRIEALYGADNAKLLRERWDAYRRKKWVRKLAEEQAKFTRRMGDISPFMKCLKQRFSVWFRNNTKYFDGTLWEGRFRSTIVEGDQKALSAVSAYIDLNPVRAKMVKDPKDYKWSGYGAAMAGSRFAERGLARVFDSEAKSDDFLAKYVERYREVLYVKGSDVIDAEEVKKVLKEKGKVPLPMLLRCKVRHFLDGAFVGSAEFIEEEFQKHRGNFSVGRTTGARPIGRCEKWCGIELCTARDLQKA